MALLMTAATGKLEDIGLTATSACPSQSGSNKSRGVIGSLPDNHHKPDSRQINTLSPEAHRYRTTVSRSSAQVNTQAPTFKLATFFDLRQKQLGHLLIF